MRQHIEQMAETIVDGVDLMGYTPWGCIVVSLSTGEMAKPYGMVYVNKFDDGTGDLSRERKTEGFALQGCCYDGVVFRLEVNNKNKHRNSLRNQGVAVSSG